jgi:hypothetical protein
MTDTMRIVDAAVQQALVTSCGRLIRLLGSEREIRRDQQLH